MEIPAEYNLAGKPWEKEEDDQLIKEYNINQLAVLELSKIHKRMPGGIISRLRHLNIIDMRSKARGYLEYEKSDLYKQICKNKQEKRTGFKNAVSTNTTINLTERQKVRLQRKELPSDILQLKHEVKEIKEKVDKILELMNALYEFESAKE